MRGLVLLLFPALVWAQTPDAVVLEHCRVITMTEERVLSDQTIVVVEDKIVAVGGAGEIEIPPGALRMDLGGKYVLPGLTDAHIHLGHPTELLSYLRHGVTTVFNLGGDYLDLFTGERTEILPLKKAVARGTVIGPNIYTTGQALDGDPPTGPYQRRLTSPAEAVAAVREQKEAGYDFIKVYDSLSPELHRSVVAAAAENKLVVIGHIPEAVGVAATLASGLQVIAHAEEFYPAFEGVDDLEATIEELATKVAEAGVYVMPNTAFIRRMKLQLEDLEGQLARPEVQYLAPRVRRWWEPRYNWYTNRDNVPEFLTQVRRKYTWLVPLTKALHERGVPLLMGSDASIPGALPGLGVHDELDDMVKAGLTPYQALQTATTNIGAFAAEHLPAETGFGTIEPGNRADLLVSRENPLSAVTNLRAVEAVMVRGKWYQTTELTELLKKRTAEFRE